MPMTTPTEMQLISSPQGAIAFCHPKPDTISSNWFTMEYWQQKPAITGSSKGPYTTWFVKPDLNEGMIASGYCVTTTVVG
ncbi:hypothetical protein [Shewanella colwelliana]|uniref:hypothetical protein n=1 Tax=Shewanella colwelliana TaxID=23 RepID=UPI0022AFFAD7|nr:hypothetical protein [Shewanella colwelliana]MCZ4339112.1 hypothetical protein [Shewanella colwelliana]